MSTKDYIRTAEILRQERGHCNPQLEFTRILTLDNLAQNFAEMFAADNPRFDRKRFLGACNATQ